MTLTDDDYRESEAAYDEWAGTARVPRCYLDGIRAAIDAVAARLRARGHFAVTDELVKVALDSVAPSLFRNEALKLLEAVSAHLAARREPERVAWPEKPDWTSTSAVALRKLSQVVSYAQSAIDDGETCKPDVVLYYASSVVGDPDEVFEHARQPEPSEPERAKAFELDLDESAALDRIEHNRARAVDPIWVCGALRRALATLAPTEREKEMERQLATERAVREIAHQKLREAERELERRIAELAELRKRVEPSEPEPARDVLEPLSDLERGALDSAQQIYEDSEDQEAHDAIVSILARFPASPSEPEPARQYVDASPADALRPDDRIGMVERPAKDAPSAYAEIMRLREDTLRRLGELTEGVDCAMLDLALSRRTKPAPASPVEALLTYWERFPNTTYAECAQKAREAIAAEKAGGK